MLMASHTCATHTSSDKWRDITAYRHLILAGIAMSNTRETPFTIVLRKYNFSTSHGIISFSKRPPIPQCTHSSPGGLETEK